MQLGQQNSLDKYEEWAQMEIIAVVDGITQISCSMVITEKALNEFNFIAVGGVVFPALITLKGLYSLHCKKHSFLKIDQLCKRVRLDVCIC